MRNFLLQHFIFVFVFFVFSLVFATIRLYSIFLLLHWVQAWMREKSKDKKYFSHTKMLGLFDNNVSHGEENFKLKILKFIFLNCISTTIDSNSNNNRKVRWLILCVKQRNPFYLVLIGKTRWEWFTRRRDYCRWRKKWLGKSVFMKRSLTVCWMEIL